MDDDLKLAAVLVTAPIILVAFILMIAIFPESVLIPKILIGGITGVLVISGAYMAMTGRGGWSIAGYNTASTEEKAQFDEKKLCRLMGTFLIFFGILMFAFFFYPKGIDTLWFLLLIIVSVLLIVVIANTSLVKKKCREVMHDMKEE